MKVHLAITASLDVDDDRDGDVGVLAFGGRERVHVVGVYPCFACGGVGVFGFGFCYGEAAGMSDAELKVMVDELRHGVAGLEERLAAVEKRYQFVPHPNEAGNVARRDTACPQPEGEGSAEARRHEHVSAVEFARRVGFGVRTVEKWKARRVDPLPTVMGKVPMEAGLEWMRRRGRNLRVVSNQFG